MTNHLGKVLLMLSVPLALGVCGLAGWYLTSDTIGGVQWIEAVQAFVHGHETAAYLGFSAIAPLAGWWRSQEGFEVWRVPFYERLELWVLGVVVAGALVLGILPLALAAWLYAAGFATGAATCKAENDLYRELLLAKGEESGG